MNLDWEEIVQACQEASYKVFGEFAANRILPPGGLKHTNYKVWQDAGPEADVEIVCLMNQVLEED